MNKVIAVVIPFKASNSERVRNLIYNIKYHKKNLPNCKIIIVEQDTVTDLKSVNNLVDIYHNIQTNNDSFRKAYLFNQGYNIAQNNFAADYIIFLDADCLIEKSILNNIKLYYDYFDKYFVIPYKRKVYYLSNKETVNFINDDQDNINDNENKDLEGIRNASGGAGIISSKNYYYVGGFDERFKGWGVEDDAFHNKCIGLGISVYRLESDLVHLYHPDAFQNYDNYGNNLKIYNEDYGKKKIIDIVNALGKDHLVPPVKK
jgi:predicted glycosyltransferase involved in capsule biosynthesis